MSRPAAFVDRDGVLNEVVPDPLAGRPESPLDPADVRLVPEAAHGVQTLSARGLFVVVVSNQPAAAKGRVTLDALAAVHAAVAGQLAEAAAEPAAWYYCHHHPDGVVPGLAGACDCRKPAPGLLLRAAADLELDLAASWMIGDTDADVAAGREAGCRTVLIEHPGSAHRRNSAIVPSFKAANLAEAARALHA